MPKLTSELVPKTAWYSNVRSNVTRAEWDVIRKQVYADAGHVCAICGEVGKKHPVECHEVWEYDDVAHTQKLITMTALCPACHCVKHLGRAQAVGIFNIAIEHMMKVNGWTRKEAMEYSKKVFAEYEIRSQHKWKLDIRALSNYNMKKTGSNETW